MDLLRVHVVRTRWAHWGRYAGITRYFDFLDPTGFSIHDEPTFHEDESVPVPRRRLWELARSGIRRGRMPWYTLHDLRSEFIALGRVLQGQVDLLHYLDPEHGMQFGPLLARRLRGSGRPGIVATFHQPPSLLPAILRPEVVRRADHVTVVSPDQAPFFEELLPPGCVSVILHGIDTSFFEPAPERPVQSDLWVCVTVGHNLRDFETLRIVAECLRPMNDIRFEVVANGVTGLEDLPNVRVRSGLSDVEFRALYQQAAMLVLPLKDATANNALLEGFACGLPTVVTDLPGIRAYAPGGEAILVGAGAPDQVVAAILQVRDDPVFASRLATAARRRAEALSWDRIAPEYARVYRLVATQCDQVHRPIRRTTAQ